METELFNKIKDLICDGFTIEKACKELKIDRSTIYNKGTELQKRELKVIKMSRSTVHRF